MAYVSALIGALIALIFPFGQLLRFDFRGISFPVLDIIVVLFSILNLIFAIKRKQKISNEYFLYFLIFTIFSFVINLFNYHFAIKSFAYLIRLAAYFSFFIFPPNFGHFKNRLGIFFYITFFSSVIFGIFQYILWPDFTFFNSFNWDPHLYRLVGSYFDPTFTALLFLFFLIVIFFQPKFKYKNLLLILIYISIALTYSRSTFLSFFVVSWFISYHKQNYKIGLLATMLIVFTVLLLPRHPGEGTKLERDSSIRAKIENYQEGIAVLSRSPFIGHGYDNLDRIRTVSNPQSHSIYGFDSSLLTIAATTGIIGLIFFCLAVLTLYKTVDFPQKTLLVALLVHSLFANSMLYSWVIVFLIFTNLKSHK